MTVVSLSISCTHSTNIKSMKTTIISLLSKNKKNAKQSKIYIKSLCCLFKIIAVSYTISNLKNTKTAHSTKKLHREQPVI